MKIRTILLALALCLSGVIASFASDANLGTWKLNEEKSKIAAGASKNLNVVYTVDGDNLKAVVDGVDGSGQPTHGEWTGKFDGKDYPIVGDPKTDTRSIETVGENNYKLTSKKDGKTVVTGTIVTSTDGKMRTVTTTSNDAQGKKVESIFVYDKQ